MGRTERLAQPQQFGKYQLIARLAHGRVADVYKAKSIGVEGFEKVLVAKLISPGFVGLDGFIDTFIDEAKRTVSLAHANVAQVYDLGFEDESGQYYIATEYVPGFDLARTRQIGRMANHDLPIELAVFVASEVAKGLDYAHRRKDYNFQSLNLVHRDLSPTNVMLSFDGEVKITDFGVSRAVELAPLVDGRDRRRRYLYLAPEVARGEEYSQKADIFALGLLMYEMLTGRHPYDSSDPEEVERRAKEGSIVPLSEIGEFPRPLVKVTESMLVPDPAGRAPNAGVVYEELVGYIFGNNLRADARALSSYMREIREEEQRVAPEQTTQEVGLEEISLSEMQIMDGLEDPSEVLVVNEATNAELPSYKLQDYVMEGEEKPTLPGALETFFNQVASGRGKAILVSGSFGVGRAFMPDRLVDALRQRDGATGYGVVTGHDDRFSPFGALGDCLIELLGCTSRAEAIDRLVELGLPDSNLVVLRELWKLEEPTSDAGGIERRRALKEAFFKGLDHASARQPVGIVVDRMESLDDVSLDVLRYVVAEIGSRRVMLVLCTGNSDLMRSSFDLGRPEDLEAVRVVSPDKTRPSAEGLSNRGSSALLLIALASRGFAHSELATLLGVSGEDAIESIRELADRGLVRVPGPGYVTSGLADSGVWVERNFDRRDIERAADKLARFFTHRLDRISVDRLAPTLVRLYALAAERQRLEQFARRLGTSLEKQGYFGTLLDFYDEVASLIATARVGAPEARIEFLLRRADLALELARIDVSRSTLQPLAALAEMTRDDIAAVRVQLLQGQLALQQDDLEEAREFFERTARGALACGDPVLLASSKLAMARWYDRFGSPREGQHLLDSALGLFRTHGVERMDAAKKSLVLNRAVRFMVGRGHLSRARQHLADLQHVAQVSRLPMARCRAEWALAVYQRANGDVASARATLANARHRAVQHDLVALSIELMREEAAAALEAGDHEAVIDTAQSLIDLAHQHQDAYSAQRGLDLQATSCCVVGRDVTEAMNHLMTSLARAQDRAVPKDAYRCHLLLSIALGALGRDADATQHEQLAYGIAERFRYAA